MLVSVTALEKRPEYKAYELSLDNYHSFAVYYPAGGESATLCRSQGGTGLMLLSMLLHASPAEPGLQPVLPLDLRQVN